MALKSWNLICMPKEVGGLGFRQFKAFNLALLAKLGWMLVSGQKTIWTDMMKAKYLKNSY